MIHADPKNETHRSPTPTGLSNTNKNKQCPYRELRLLRALREVTGFDLCGGEHTLV